jgi:glycerol-3-phosphate O-acyltransferase
VAHNQSQLRWFGWLRALLSPWISAKVMPPDNILSEIGVNPAKPICYVLRSSSVFDLLLLDIYCQKLRLPRPQAHVDELDTTSDAGSIYLAKVGLLRTYGAYRHQPPSPFFKLLKRVDAEPTFDVQMVPVSVYWGKDPGIVGKSIFKLLFPDDDRAGFFLKALIVIAHGRNALLSFSKPISLRDEFEGADGIEETARKLTRVVRVHFQNKRVAMFGPGLISRNRVIETMIRQKHLSTAIDEEAKKKKISRHKAEVLAKEYISEIAAEVTPQMIAGIAILLKRLWAKMYDGILVQNLERIRQLPTNAEIIYVPCHRSHADYMLLNYVLFQNGEVTPHVAAGVNLNFWPVGSLLRRFGAFYIRRTFSNNRLYSVVFSEYVSFLLQRGAPLQFFLEGGRSRSGKLLQPKTGMVAMVFQSFLRNSSRPFYFIPVYIGYDNVMEVKSYRRELSGAKKRSESVGQLVKTRKAFKHNHGYAYIGFGKPLDLKKYLDDFQPNWRSETYSLESKPSWLNPAVAGIANEVMREINENAFLDSVGLVVLILNASRTKAMIEDELVQHVDAFLKIATQLPYSDSTSITKISAKEIVTRAEKFGKLSRFSHPGGDVLHLLEPQASYSIYARNNIAHLFAVPSLVAFFLQHNDHISEDVILGGCRLIYPILKGEFFLKWREDEYREIVLKYIDLFVNLGLFERHPGGFSRPPVTSGAFTILRTLGLVVGAAVERFSVAVNLLQQHQEQGAFNAEEFQSKCVLMAQRISLLTGASDNELPSPALFKLIFDRLIQEGYLTSTESGFKIEGKFKEVYSITSSLLSVDMRHSMSRARN